jgi:maltose/moltooligosaccharide transporter
MKKPPLSFWQIWNMSFGFLGIHLWIAAPVTGLIVQPIIGHMSDNTWNRLGRRRPYFLVGAILASIAILFMPNSPALWVAAGMLWIMDASINISMEPFRAFVGDMLPSEQRTQGFAMQSFFIGTGAVIASALPYMMTNWFGISNVAPKGVIPDSVKYSFYIGGAVFFLAVAYTVFRTKEYSPEELKNFSDEEEEESSKEKEIRTERKTVTSHKFLRDGFIWLSIGTVITLFLAFILNETDYGLYVLFVGAILFGLLQIVAGTLTKNNKIENGFVVVLNDLYNMPKTMQQLSYVQFFSWFALFAMWIYTTPAVTHHIYGTSDPTTALYNEGADWVGVLMAVYNGFAASRKTVHMVSLFAGGIGLASFYVFKDPDLLIISELGIGLAWASILAMPYAILAGSLPAEKMGVYMGIFNFFIVIPQITAASILGFFTRTVFGNEAIYTLILGGVSMIIAGLLVLKVDDVDELH